MASSSSILAVSFLDITTTAAPRKCIDSHIRLRKKKRNTNGKLTAMVQDTSAAYAKEMERLSAKESLLLAFKDAGGFEALVTGKTTDMQRIDVNERIVCLERLNPTPRPTTSPYLEGRWNVEWYASGTVGPFSARVLFERFPPALANLSQLDMVIKDKYASISVRVKLLDSIESNIIVSTKLSVEGPLRMKEEYLEGMVESPKVNEQSIPPQLKSAFYQAVTAVEQLPSPLIDAVAGGLKVPLGGTFERLFMISYLDDEILNSSRLSLTERSIRAEQKGRLKSSVSYIVELTHNKAATNNKNQNSQVPRNGKR